MEDKNVGAPTNEQVAGCWQNYKFGFSHTNKLIIERLEGEGERHVRMLEKSMEISHLCLF